MRLKHKVLLVSFFFGLFIWFFDSFLDYFAFYEGAFLDLLVLKVPRHELYIRSLFLACFVAFGLVAANIMGKLEKSEKSRREREEWFSTTLRSIGEAVIATDVRGKITFLNPAAERLTGWDKDLALGRSLEKVISIINQTSGEQIKGLVGRILKKGLVRGSTDQTLLLTRAGSMIPIEESGAPIRSEEGRAMGTVMVLQDVSERKKAEAESQRLELQLVQSQKMEAVGTLAGGVAHEFNNILAAIVGNGELALDLTEKGEQNTTELENILFAADRAKELVKRILSFSRKGEVDLKPLFLRTIIEESLNIYNRIIPRMIEVRLDLAQDLKPVLGDAGQIEQILMNLWSNGADAMPEGGLLTIEASNVFSNEVEDARLLEEAPGEYVLIKVRDTGVGMNQEIIERIFDPFFSTKRVGQGTGLGLSTVYSLIKSHRGYITCSSQPGKGTSFRIYLPVHVPQEVEFTPAISREKWIRGGQELILIVEDEEVIRDINKKLLEKYGYKTLSAASGEEALTIYSQQGSVIDLVLMDISMPGMGGLKCLKKLRQLDPAVKVVMASGYLPEGASKESLNSGAASFVAKPFRQDEVLRVIRQVLDQGQAIWMPPIK